MKTATWYEKRRKEYRKRPLAGEKLTALAVRAKNKRERGEDAKTELLHIEEAMGGACAYHAHRLRRGARLSLPEYEDLLQAGALSIIRSVDAYDEGIPAAAGFRSFCYQRIWWAMIRALDELYYPRIPVYKRKERELLAPCVSLEAYEEEHGELGETDAYATRCNPTDEDELEHTFWKMYFDHLSSEADKRPDYDERKRLIVEYRMGLTGLYYNLEEVADLLEITRERVWQLQKAGLSILRDIAKTSPAYIRYRDIEARYRHIAEARATRELLQENHRETRHLSPEEAYIAQRRKLQRRSPA